jgi:hypothetical protein
MQSYLLSLKHEKRKRERKKEKENIRTRKKKFEMKEGRKAPRKKEK